MVHSGSKVKKELCCSKLVFENWFKYYFILKLNFNFLLKRPDAFDDGEGDDIILDETVENDQTAKPVKKETKKPTKQNKQTKLSAAVASDKNNSSLLSFFQKSQKRPLPVNDSSSCPIIANFLVSRKLKLCKSF